MLIVTLYIKVHIVVSKCYNKHLLNPTTTNADSNQSLARRIAFRSGSEKAKTLCILRVRIL